VKETHNARSEYTNNETDGKAEHHLNQYLIKDEIGRGSFGAVHFAVDQYGKEFVSTLLLDRGSIQGIGKAYF
jgi:[calcium/calmodulin-dependent protein kinase] kinase